MDPSLENMTVNTALALEFPKKVICLVGVVLRMMIDEFSFVVFVTVEAFHIVFVP